MVRYLFILKNNLKKLVMAFTASNIQTPKNDTETPLPLSQLNAKEIEILLSLIKTSTFLGEDVEVIYNMVVKLQNQYLDQTK